METDTLPSSSGPQSGPSGPATSRINRAARMHMRSKRRLCCHKLNPLQCSSRRRRPPVRSPCARWTAGGGAPRSLSIRSLTSPHDWLTSSRWRLRQTQFQHKSRRHHGRTARTQSSRDSYSDQACHRAPVQRILEAGSADRYSRRSAALDFQPSSFSTLAIAVVFLGLVRTGE
jgi:hypothetical protein